MAEKIFNNGRVFIPDKSNIAVPSLITEGSCNVYVCRVKDSKPYGRRYFLFSLGKGDIFFPFEIKGDDTRIIAVVVSDLRIDDAENFSVSKYKVQVCAYVIKLLNALEKSKADIDLFLQQLDDKSLFDLNVSFPENAAEIIFKTENSEKIRSRRHFEKERSTYYQSFGILARTMKSDKQLKNDSSGDIDDNLFKACKIITSFLKINISVPDYLKKGCEVRNPLEEIAFVSRFRTRKISLGHNWYKSPSTPILAYLKTSDNSDDDIPVALIPRLTHYDIYNPADNSTHRLNRKVVHSIRSDAYVIYRNLPAEKLAFSDILKFAANGIKTSDIACLIGFGLIGGMLGAVSPLIISWIFDTVIPDSNQSMLLQLFIILLNITVVNFVFEVIRSFSLMRIENSIELDLQSSVWDRLLSLPAAFFKKFSAGELAQKLDGISDIAQIISSNTINQVLSSVFGIFYVIVMFSINPNLALISSGLILISCVISLLIGMREIKYYQNSINLSNSLSGKMYSWIQGISKIRLAGAESRVFNMWSEKFSEIRREDTKRSGLNNASVIFTSSASILISICLYSFMVDGSSDIASGTFIAFNTALQTVLLNTLSASSTLTELNTIIPLYKNIKPVLEAIPEYDENYSDIGEITGDIEISHISFRYDKDLPLVLDDVSIHIKSGEHVALVGPSGSGKSTLLRILLGFEKAETGQIYFDGKDISQVDIRTLRKQLGVVLQSGKLLPGSIFENIVGANFSVTIDEVNEAVEKAGLTEDIEDMPMGLHTVISEDSNTLSGGQRQRLLIARAIISNPKILFFDEATSALDNKTQEIVKKNVDALNITRITIAHRLSTITDCDRIIVLKDGRIAEEGTYKQLMDKNGIFTEMAKRQIM